MSMDYENVENNSSKRREHDYYEDVQFGEGATDRSAEVDEELDIGDSGSYEEVAVGSIAAHEYENMRRSVAKFTD